VAHYIGLLATTLGRFAEADDHFAAAAATQEGIGAPVPLARTQLEWGRMMLIRNQPGDAERVRELLGEAVGTARELSVANVERRGLPLGICPPLSHPAQNRDQRVLTSEAPITPGAVAR